jgi:hypothetical protein
MHGRFTRLEGRHMSGEEAAFVDELGRTWGELGFQATADWAEALDGMSQGGRSTRW